MDRNIMEVVYRLVKVYCDFLRETGILYADDSAFYSTRENEAYQVIQERNSDYDCGRVQECSNILAGDYLLPVENYFYLYEMAVIDILLEQIIKDRKKQNLTMGIQKILAAEMKL